MRFMDPARQAVEKKKLEHYKMYCLLFTSSKITFTTVGSECKCFDLLTSWFMYR